MGCVLARKKKQVRKELVVLLSGGSMNTSSQTQQRLINDSRPPPAHTPASRPERAPLWWKEQSRLIPQGFKWLAESILELNKEINCFAGYKAQNVLRDETKILCVFLMVQECRIPGRAQGHRLPLRL